MTRKEELKKELGVIEEKEMAVMLKDLKSLNETVDNKIKYQDAIAHKWIMGGDFLIKLFVAVGVTAAFMHVVYTGNVDAMESDLIGGTAPNGNFQLLSVLGPLFGMVLQYYFGKNKAGSNGE